MKSNKVKRAYKRLEVYHLVKYRNSVLGSKSPLILAHLRDISANGGRLVTKEALPVASLLQVYVSFPWLPSAVMILAKVAWIKKMARKEQFESGIMFQEIDEATRKDIFERVKNAC